MQAREHHEATVRSLKERHENEIAHLQREIDSLEVKGRGLEVELEDIKEKYSETQRLHESALVEKSERIDDLNSKLSEAQKKLSDLIMANGAHDYAMRSGGQGQGQGQDPVGEILELKSTLEAITQQREQQRKVVHDLKDELAEVLAKLDNSQRKERLLRQDLDTLKRDNLDLENVDQIREENFNLQKALSGKTAELDVQQRKTREIMEQWEQQLAALKANHGQDHRDLEELRAKHRELKIKVRNYQKTHRKERQDWLDKEQEMRETFNSILAQYKEQMEQVYGNREKQILDQLETLQQHYEKTERDLRRRVAEAEADPPSITLSASSRPTSALTRPARTASDEENVTPSPRMTEKLKQITDNLYSNTKLVSPKLPLASASANTVN